MAAQQPPGQQPLPQQNVDRWQATESIVSIPQTDPQPPPQTTTTAIAAHINPPPPRRWVFTPPNRWRRSRTTDSDDSDSSVERHPRYREGGRRR